ncbi:hypothetical protein E2I00_009881, partial [Balaenoptera physalus]
MASYPYGQGCPGAGGQAPGAPPGSYYPGLPHAGGQYASGVTPGGGYGGSPAPGGPYGPPAGGGPYAHPNPGGLPSGTPGGPYGGAAPGGPYGPPPPNSYGAQHPGPYGQGTPPPDMFDKTKSGRIDVYGFSALWKFIQQWKNLFQQYDRDRSGSISYTELQQ